MLNKAHKLTCFPFTLVQFQSSFIRIAHLKRLQFTPEVDNTIIRDEKTNKVQVNVKVTVLEIVKSMSHKVSKSEEKMGFKTGFRIQQWGVFWMWMEMVDGGPTNPPHTQHYSKPAEWGQRSPHSLPRQSDALEEMSLKLVWRKTYSTYITPHMQVTFAFTHVYFWEEKKENGLNLSQN